MTMVDNCSERSKGIVEKLRGSHHPPDVWKTIDAEEKLKDDKRRAVKLAIQDIPEGRFQDAVDLMSQYHIAEAVTFKCLSVKDDRVAVQEMRSFWRHLLKLGMSVGAFELDTNGKLGQLVGVNLLYMENGEIDGDLKNMLMNCKSEKLKKILSFNAGLLQKVDVKKIYGVDSYLYDSGMVVKPSFRGQKLGVLFLEARTEIGRKHGITVSLTIFSGPSSQRLAERADFQSLLTLKYAKAVDENGEVMFPGIEAEVTKLMVKKLY